MSAPQTLALVLPPDLLFQEPKANHLEPGALLVVLAVAVATGFRLVEPGLVAHGLELCRHLARMPGMDTVVASRGGDQDRRIRLAGLDVVIGGVGLEPVPLLGLV